MSNNPPELPDLPDLPEEPEQPEKPALPEVPETAESTEPRSPEQPQYSQQQPAQYAQQQPAQYAQQQPPTGYAHPAPAPPGPQHPPVPTAWQPPSPAGGKIWLGILIGAGVPILGFLLGGWADSGGLYGLSTALMALPFWLVLILAIVITIIRSQRRTGIGMWIGLAALPIVGFGVCVVMVFGIGGAF